MRNMKLKGKRIAAVSMAAIMALTNVNQYPYHVKAAEETVPMQSVSIDNVTYYYAVGNADSTFTAGEETVSAERIGESNVYYYVKDGEALSGKLYGTTDMTWKQYWENESITYDKDNYQLDQKNDTADSNKELDLGGYDAVTRATSAHGIYRAGFKNVVYAEFSDDSGENKTNFRMISTDEAELQGTFVTDEEGGYVKDSNGYVEIYCGDMKYGVGRGVTLEFEGTTYTKVAGYTVEGPADVPVEMDAEDYVKNILLEKAEDETAVTAFSKVILSDSVSDKTNGLKRMNTDGSFGAHQSVSSAENTSLTKAPELKASLVEDSFGNYVQVRLAGDGYYPYAKKMTGVIWEYYGETNPDTDSSAEAEAVYGTKMTADNWFHSKLGFQLGLNTSYRQGSSEKYGYWKLTIMADGYEDFSTVIKFSGRIMKKLELAGYDCFYFDASGIEEESLSGKKFLAGEKEIEFGELKQIDGTDIYYTVSTASGQGLTGSFYGTADLSYSDYYAGDTSVSEYDAVSSATVNKSTIFPNAAATATQAGIGYQISGVKNVPVAVDAEVYVEAKIQEAAKIKTEGIYTTAAAITLNENATQEPSQYKKLTENGYTERVEKEGSVIQVTDAKASLNTTSRWGDYEIDVTETSTKYIRNTREDGNFAVNSKIQGMILETSDGTKVGMRHLKEIWVQPYEAAFDADSEAGRQLIGKTVNKITYLMADKSYVYEFADGIYIKPQLPENSTVNAVFTSDMTKLDINIDTLPSDIENPTVSVYKKEGRDTIYYAEKEALKEDRIALTTAGAVSTEETVYTVIVSSDNYADLSVEVSNQLKNIKEAEITLSPDSFTYDGTEKKPAVTVRGLTEGTDYTIAYSNNISTGTAVVTITGTGEYAGVCKKTYQINQESNNTTGNTSGDTTGNTSGNTAGNTTTDTSSSTAGNTTTDTSGNITGNTTTGTDGSASNTPDSAETEKPDNSTGNQTSNPADNTANTEQNVDTSLLDKIKVSISRKTLYVNGTTGKIAKTSVTLPEGLTAQQVTLSYSITDTDVATISSSGKIKAAGTGKATVKITAALSDGTQKTFMQTVAVKKASLKITKFVTKLKTGAQSVFKAEIKGFAASDLTWKSSKASVVSVKKSGNLKAAVKAKKQGNAVITVKAGTKKASVKVTITKKASGKKSAS
jgi:hypothetical protein